LLGKDEVTTIIQAHGEHKYCMFHQDHGYETKNCYALQNQLEKMIKKWKLLWFVANQQLQSNQENRGEDGTKRGLENRG
jgi:hypothetical protein